MRSILLVTFREARAAHHAMSGLRQLDADGTIAVRTGALLERQSDGRLRVSEDADNVGLTATTSGGLVGALLGALSGPVGVLLGGAAGAAAGAVSDGDEAAASELLLTTIASRVPPGATAVVADVDEPAPDILDALAARLGGALTRRSRSEVEAKLKAAEDPERKRRERLKVAADRPSGTACLMSRARFVGG